MNEVVDILSVKESIEDPVKDTKGILGSVIVDKNVATVIDIYSILDSVLGVTVFQNDPPFISSGSTVLKTPSKLKSGAQRRILFAEDTAFFAKHVRTVLEKNGYKITHALDGEIAWQILSSSKPGDFQAILSDIEMPKMTGFELAEKVRGDSRFAHTPMIALTTKFRDVDREKGLKVGFIRYLEKLRPEELLDALREILA